MPVRIPCRRPVRGWSVVVCRVSCEKYPQHFAACSMFSSRLMNLNGSVATKSRGLEGDTKLLESLLFPNSKIPGLEEEGGGGGESQEADVVGKASCSSSRSRKSSAGGAASSDGARQRCVL